ncbi:cell wall / vacuolar inhibitor of fructosidase 2-like [Malania oleifera]|uniref:cell wall / vacuolar inhibitor of fructosidase 2-like n=1 Tax=Malania oleifera TaxID=397392 RepID=UPI0025AE200D|nr:cell wall / vacuolar inhibitor of fructosidase 2-like [Malania oleifera]
MESKYLRLALLLFVLAISHFFVMARADLIKDSCKNTYNYTLCVSTLRSDPSTSNSTINVKGLAYVMLNVLNANNTKILAEVSHLLNTTKDPLAIQCLQRCFSDYTVNKDFIRTAYSLLNSNNYGDANSQMAFAADEAIDCESSFTEPPIAIKSPLTTTNNVFEQLAYIIADIINILG